LSSWKSPNEIEAYAAACAAKGDFAEAVKWQKKVLTHSDYLNRRAGEPKLWLDLFEMKKSIMIEKKKIID
jgi:hypothetical protein